MFKQMNKKKLLLIAGVSVAVLVVIALVVISVVRYNSMRGTCGNNLTWVYDGDGTLTIFGTGKMEDYDHMAHHYPGWNNFLGEIDTIIIEDGVKSIGNDAFRPWRADTSGLTEVYIADSVSVIGEGAFSDCANLTEIDIPDKVTKMGSGAFMDCTSLKEINLPNRLEIIEVNTFSGCESLRNIVIPASVKSIKYGAFCGCSSLSEIWFEGAYPFAESSDVFNGVTATAHINAYLWNDCDVGKLGGNIKWTD